MSWVDALLPASVCLPAEKVCQPNLQPQERSPVARNRVPVYGYREAINSDYVPFRDPDASIQATLVRSSPESFLCCHPREGGDPDRDFVENSAKRRFP
jgi:hypothetical protein